MVSGQARPGATEQAMVTWSSLTARFLRLFPVFADLEERVDIQARELYALEGVDARAGDLLRQKRHLESELADLRESYHSLQMEKLMLQDRLEASLTDKDRLWGLMEGALAGERTAYQMHVNEAWQRRGAGIPYPAAPHLEGSAARPVQESGPIGRRARILPSELGAQRTGEFIREFVASKESETASS